MLLTTTCFGPQVAIIRLYALKLILAHCTLYLLQSAQPDDGHLRAETHSYQLHPTYAI